MSKYGPHVNEEYSKQIESARNELRTIITDKNCAPQMLRLAFSDAGTYVAKKKTGGPNGSIRMELSNPENNDIKEVVDLCEQVKAKHHKITYADLYQLAGVVAIEVVGGPKIPYTPGRRDALQEEMEGNTQGLQNPNGDVTHLRDVFHRMGFSDKEIVALSGSLTLGRSNPNTSTFGDFLTMQPLKFDNSYYVELSKEETPKQSKFALDKLLIEDPKFHKYVKLYAEDKRKFYEDYVKAHKKLTELGIYRPKTFDDENLSLPMHIMSVVASFAFGS